MLLKNSTLMHIRFKTQYLKWWKAVEYIAVVYGGGISTNGVSDVSALGGEKKEKITPPPTPPFPCKTPWKY